MHRHFCETYGHDYECGEDCECICGLCMEGNDHSDCPVELRPCHEHPAPDVDLHTERPPDAVEIDFCILSAERQQSLPTCNCGCAEIESGASVGFCAWCSHRYRDYSPTIEADHFAKHCPCAPDEVKSSARETLAHRKR